MEVIKPFEFLSEEECARRLAEIEAGRHPEKQPMVVIETKPEPSHKVDYGNIRNETNPFLNFCKRAFDFAKDNIRIRVSAMPFNKSVAVSDFIPGPMDKIRVPQMSTTIGIGPLELNLNSDEKDIPLDNFKFKKGKGIYT